jgi:hypothetical protein
MLMLSDWSSSTHCAFVVQNDNRCPTRRRPSPTTSDRPVR